MLTQSPTTLTPRESYTMEYEERQNDKQIAFGTKMKELEIEQAKLEAKWSAWLRIPTLIIRLPFLMILALAYIVHAIRGIEPGENYWQLLK